MLNFIKLVFKCFDHYSQAIKEVGKDTGIKGRGLYFPLNLAFTGSTSAPQIYEIMDIY